MKSYQSRFNRREGKKETRKMLAEIKVDHLDYKVVCDVRDEFRLTRDLEYEEKKERYQETLEELKRVLDFDYDIVVNKIKVKVCNLHLNEWPFDREMKMYYDYLCRIQEANKSKFEIGRAHV